MSWFANAQRRLWHAAGDNLDLILLGWALIVAAPLTPVGQLLARPALAPWQMLCLTGVALLRSRRLNEGPHPQLTERRSGFDAMLRRMAVSAAPAALLSFYNAGYEWSWWWLGVGVALSIGIGTFLWLGSNDGKTSWNPTGIAGWQVWGGSVMSTPCGASPGGIDPK